MKQTFYVFLAILSLGLPARSEVLLMKNGDRLTGKWVRVVGETVVFRGDSPGEVSIPVGKIGSFDAEDPVVALLKGGETIRGKLSLGLDGNWEVTSESNARTVPSNQVAGIYPEKVYLLLAAPPQRARILCGWNGNGTLGYSMARGDTQAGTLSFGADATRRAPNLPGLNERFRTHYSLSGLFAETQSFEGVKTSANSLGTALRQDYLFSATNFVFGLGQLDHIQSQGLDLRQTYGAGLGHDLLKTKKVDLSFIGGATFVRENLQDSTGRNNAEALMGEKLSLQITSRTRLEQNLNVSPVLSDLGEIQADTKTTLSAKINARLSLNAGFSDNYLSNPSAGHTRNQLVMTTGIGVIF